jgi:uncharacterized protein with PQ loop repeat
MGFFCNLLSTCIFTVALIKTIRTEQSTELSVSMNVLFVFGSLAQTIRFATLTLSLVPREIYFGETTVSIDYIFSGATTTARWLFTWKMWVVFYQVPQIFQGD